MSTISVVVLAKNEEANIGRCISSLQWADEVVVVDDQSSDQTTDIAVQCGARVVQHRFESFAKQRNWALKHGQLTGQWVLMLDADEVATQPFAAEIREKIRATDGETVAFRTCRKTMLDGVWLKRSDSFPVWIMRLVKCGHAWFEDSGHGEVPIPKLDGKCGTIKEPFVHYPFSRGMDDWWMRHVRYAGREATRERISELDASIWSIFSLDASQRRRSLRAIARKLPARGFLRLFYQLILKRGFLDGPKGWRFCRMMACYESMIAIRRLEPDTNDETNSGHDATASKE